MTLTLTSLNYFNPRLPPPPSLSVSNTLSFHMSASFILLCVRGQIQVVPTKETVSAPAAAADPLLPQNHPPALSPTAARTLIPER